MAASTRRTGLSRRPPSTGEEGGPLPLYRRVQGYILDLIEKGQWEPDRPIPSESQLVETLKVSRMTVNRALREMAAQGLLTRLQGVGTFVARREPEFAMLEIRDIAEEIKARGGRHRARVLLLRGEKASPEAAAGLGLSPGGRVFHSLILHGDENGPVQMEDRFVNPRTVPGYLEQDFTALTPNRYLVQTVPLSTIEVEHLIEAVKPDPETARLLEIGADEPCLVLTRRTWTRSASVTLVRLVNPGSRYRLRGRFKP